MKTQPDQAEEEHAPLGARHEDVLSGTTLIGCHGRMVYHIRAR